MSHFTVLVPAKDETELLDRLTPYYEYGCSADMDERVKPYLEFEIDYTAEEVAEEAEAIRDDDTPPPDLTDAQVVVWAEGGDVDEAGNVGRWTNPNAKWDWYTVGGRWDGNVIPDNRAAAGIVRWDWKRKKQGIDAEKRYRAYHELLLQRTTEKMTEQEFNHALIDVAGLWKDPDLDTLTLNEYVAKHEAKAPVFAFIDLDGQWHERGHMGWWAIVSDQQPDYDTEFWQFVKTLPADQILYLVDCHI